MSGPIRELQEFKWLLKAWNVIEIFKAMKKQIGTISVSQTGALWVSCSCITMLLYCILWMQWIFSSMLLDMDKNGKAQKIVHCIVKRLRVQPHSGCWWDVSQSWLRACQRKSSCLNMACTSSFQIPALHLSLWQPRTGSQSQGRMIANNGTLESLKSEQILAWRKGYLSYSFFSPSPMEMRGKRG